MTRYSHLPRHLTRSCCTVAAAAFTLYAPQAHAAVIIEDFAYPNGDEVQGNSGGSGWAGNWSAETTRVYAVGASLSYTGGGYDITQTQDGTGSKAGTGLNALRGLRRNLPAGLDDTVWFSYLVSNNNAATAPYVAIQWNPASAAALGANYIQFIDDRIDVNYGGSLTSDITGAIALARNTTHLVLGRWTVGAGNDALDIWINPTDLTALGAAQFSANTANVGSSLTSLGIIGLGTGSGTGNVRVFADALRVSDGDGDPDTAFTDVTGVSPVVIPEPASLALLSLGSLLLASRKRRLS